MAMNLFHTFLFGIVLAMDNLGTSYGRPTIDNEIGDSKTPLKQVRKDKCWSTEPCKYQRRDPQAPLGFRDIPTWCECHPDQICEFSHEDITVLSLVYRCFPKAEDVLLARVLHTRPPTSYNEITSTENEIQRIPLDDNTSSDNTER